MMTSVESREIDLKELLKKTHSNEGDHAPDNNHNERHTLTLPPPPLRLRTNSDCKSKHLLAKYWRKPSFKRQHKTKQEKGEEQAEDEHSTSVSLQQQLAMTALNLTVPASSTLMRSQRQKWVQLAGHPGSLAPAGPGTVWKKQPPGTSESGIYEQLMKDSVRSVVPTFYREICYEGEKFIELSDLLYNFENPSVIDIKMGCRTFLEAEVTNTKARSDLYEKMIKVDPSAPTAEEHESQSITKLRYMQFREKESTSRSLGFRIEAIKMSDSSSVMEVKKIRFRDEVSDVLRSFVKKRDRVRKSLLGRLKVIRKLFEDSEFFSSHEVIGSSILMVYDERNFGAWIIDFAKTFPLPPGVQVTHRKPWELGNHEEGFLTGLDNLIKCMEDLPSTKKRKIRFFHKS